MDHFIRLMTIVLWGGFIYSGIELIWRGYTHPSMFITGGICFLLIGGINNFYTWSMPIFKQATIGALIVTVIELISGLIVNCWFKLDIWDYTDMPLNILGQICLPYSILWVPLSLVGIFLDDYLRWKLYGEEIPHYVIKY